MKRQPQLWNPWQLTSKLSTFISVGIRKGGKFSLYMIVMKESWILCPTITHQRNGWVKGPKKRFFLRKMKACPNHAAQLSRAVIVEKAINISMLIFKNYQLEQTEQGVRWIELLVKSCRLFLAEQTHSAALGILYSFFHGIQKDLCVIDC